MTDEISTPSKVYFYQIKTLHYRAKAPHLVQYLNQQVAEALRGQWQWPSPRPASVPRGSLWTLYKSSRRLFRSLHMASLLRRWPAFQAELTTPFFELLLAHGTFPSVKACTLMYFEFTCLSPVLDCELRGGRRVTWSLVHAQRLCHAIY